MGDRFSSARSLTVRASPASLGSFGTVPTLNVGSRTALGEYGTRFRTMPVLPALVPFNRPTTFPGKSEAKKTIWKASPTMAGTGQRNQGVFIGQRADRQPRTPPLNPDDYYTRWNRGER